MPQRRNPRLRRWQDRAEVALWYLGRIVRCGLRPRWHRAVANALGDASDLCNSLERELRAGWSKFREPAVLQARLNAVRRGLEAAWRIESGRGDDDDERPSGRELPDRGGTAADGTPAADAFRRRSVLRDGRGPEAGGPDLAGPTAGGDADGPGGRKPAEGRR